MTRIFILWNESYSVGIKRIDEQHKNLVLILNMLYESFVDQTTGQKLKEIIDQLIDYTRYHFKAEEELFKQSDYPDTERHIEEHNEFIVKVARFKTEFEAGKTNLTFQLMNFLRNWLINHIAISDQDYAGHFRSKGVS